MRKVLFLLGIGALLGGCAVDGEDLYADVTFAQDEPELTLTDDDLNGDNTADDSTGEGGMVDSGGNELQSWEVEGEVTCDALGFYGSELLTIDEVDSGDYDVEQTTVSLTTDGNTLDFTSTAGIRAVLVHGGPGATVNAFAGDTFEHVGLHAPMGEFAAHAITSVSFCAVP